MENIVLIGFMGTGKSTVGKELAVELGWEYLDSDEAIISKAGMDIPALFAERGEAAFRELERDVIRELMAGSRQVIATGGGAVLAEANRQAMLERGFVVALLADRETILHRVRGDANRPLLAGDLEARVDKLLADRAGCYEFAHMQSDTASLTPGQVCEAIQAAYSVRRRERGAAGGV